MRIQIPEGSTGVKGAVRIQPQENVYLLSFVTGERTAESMVEDLRPDSPLTVAGESSSSLSGKGFEHLGLTAPQEIKGVRTASACPPCVGDSRRRHIQGMEVHVGEAKGQRVRLYLTAY
ncbi:hypothetical protein ACFV0R_28185 [Streptomyces sp. NPDC059578]|uniref:hypothetical protein n=1 Tax=Streptomyces sp. NPDC059578 TaxID=3346874 RepID=UPI0036ACB606